MTQPSDTPPPHTTNEPVRRFRETALASGLVTAGRIDSCESRLVGEHGEAIRADDRRWDAECANLLVQQGAITRFQADQLLAGRSKLTLGQYEIVDELGHGGMGQVFRARHALMGRTVAIKVLPRSKSTPKTEASFQREIRMLARLDHENVVRALDAGYDGKVYYLVTELVPGLDLRRQVSKHGPLDETTAVSVIAQAAKALSYAHSQGLVHRDIKPSNLLVSPDGRVKVLDLGLAGSIFEEESTLLSRFFGTMDYMAPEQIRAPDAVGPQADIYSLGCTLYFTLTGKLPFPGGTRKEKARRQLTEQPLPIRQLRPELDEGLCRVVEMMMRKNPRERPGSADAVIDLLRAWAPPRPVPMPRSGTGRRSSVHSSCATAGSSGDGGTAEASHASQQATAGSEVAGEETLRSGSSAGERPPMLPLIRQAVARGVRCLVVATVVALVVAALARQVGGVGLRLGSTTGWLAFWAALSWQVWRARTARFRRRGG